MKPVLGLLAILGGLVMIFAGAQRQAFNSATGEYDWSWGFHDPVFIAVGIAAIVGGVALVMRSGWKDARPMSDRDETR